MYEGCNFSTSLPTFVIVFFILICMKWYISLLLICISLMTNEVGAHFHCGYWPFVYVLWKKIVFRSLAYFSIGLFVFSKLYCWLTMFHHAWLPTLCTTSRTKYSASLSKDEPSKYEVSPPLGAFRRNCHKLRNQLQNETNEWILKIFLTSEQHSFRCRN